LESAGTIVVTFIGRIPHVTTLFTHRRFAGFGPSAFDPQTHSLHGTSGRSANLLLQRLRKICPKIPGVYGMIDPRDRLVYVGKAKNLRSRLLCYFRPNSRDPKAGRILEAARSIVWEESSSEFAALLRELELIRRWQPSYNVQGQPGRRRVVYAVLSRSPAPHFSVAREPPSKAIASWGPIVGAVNLRAAVRRLNDAFRLRDCEKKQTIHFADQGTLFPIVRPAGCLRYEIGTCSGPCNEGVSRLDYARQVRSARAFLDGKDSKLLEALETEMHTAATNLQFERAVALRDKLVPLRWLHGRLAWLRDARQSLSFVYPIFGDDGRSLWYVIRRGQVQAVVNAPHNGPTRAAARKALADVFDRTAASGSQIADQMDSILLVAGWFRRRPEERVRLMTPDEAMGLCGSSKVAV
jgi:excinuclease ABC subunit C